MSALRDKHGLKAVNESILSDELVIEDSSSHDAVKHTTGQKSSLQGSWPGELLFLLLKILAVVVAFLLLFTFIFGASRYEEAAMYPAIKDGDLVVFSRYASERYLPQDVVALTLGGEIQFRRVIATAGDTVDITENGLVINGAPQQELGIIQKTERYQEGIDFPLVVPEGQVFVLGDNRTESIDSRIYGCVGIEDIQGKVMMILRKRGI